MTHTSPVTARELLGLAGPAALATMLHQAFRPLDQYFVAAIGGDAQAALGATTFVSIVAYAGFVMVSAGAGPLVARAVGARDEGGQGRVLGSALVGAALVAAILVVVGLVGAEAIAGLLGLEGAVHDMAATYVRTLFVAGVGLAFIPVVDATFHATGDTRLPLLFRVVALAINAVLTPTFIVVGGLGVAGAALGTAIAETVVAAVGLTLLIPRVGLRRSDLGLGELARIVRVGLPVAGGTAMYAGVYWVLLAVAIAPLGRDVTAGLGLGFNVLESFSWPMFWGAAVAVSSVVGRRLGAGEPREAWRAARMVAGPAAATGFGFSLLFWFAGPGLMTVWAADEGACREGVRYALILAWSQPFVALEAWSEGVLGGAGDTRKIFWGSVPFNLLRIPLAWALAFPLGWGAAGVWWAINVTTLVKSTVKCAMVVHGGWMQKQV